MISVCDKTFELSIPEAEILANVDAVAKRIDADYEGRNPLLVCVLKGAFIFCSDLVRRLRCNSQVEFIRLSSYHGTKTSGKVTELMGLTADITGRDVIIVEDIVDSGITLYNAIPRLRELGAKTVEVCALFAKPENLRVPLQVKYVAMEITPAFIVGYGLDFNEQGRQYRDIYQLKADN